MSVRSLLATVNETQICEFCGLEIENEKQQCPALDDGRCRP